MYPECLVVLLVLNERDLVFSLPLRSRRRRSLRLGLEFLFSPF